MPLLARSQNVNFRTSFHGHFGWQDDPIAHHGHRKGPTTMLQRGLYHFKRLAGLFASSTFNIDRYAWAH
jgi:hypothetical protein